MMTKANTKYKTVKRNANVGERILITKATETRGMYKNDDILTVSEVNVWGETGTVRVREHGRPIYGLEYEVIIEESPSDSERITALETQVAELQAELQTLKKRKKPKHPTPNEQRKAVIERAKAFVADTQRKMKDSRFESEGNDFLRVWLTEVEFVVNAKKRTVVAIVRKQYVSDILTKGIAKCAPDDVFNADIGKAIALGRALGLDVSEFENATKPTEVVVGMEVNRFNKFGINLGQFSVREIRKLTVAEAHIYGDNTHAINGGMGYCENYGDHIFDDTEAQY